MFDTGIIPTVNNWLLEESKKIRDYGDYWSASSAGYCHRKNIFERLGVPPVTEDARKQRVFSSGHIFHQWIQGITKEAGLSIAQELELQDEDLMVRGHIDDLVMIYAASPLDGKDRLILYDYKTAHSKWFEYVKSRPMNYYHRHQLGTYMYMLRNMHKEKGAIAKHFEKAGFDTTHPYTNLTEARRLAISKDDLRLHEQQLLWSDELQTDVLSYWNGLNEAWDTYNKTDSLPPCVCLQIDGGWYGRPDKHGKVYNPFFFNGEPCSEMYFKQWLDRKEKQHVHQSKT